MERTKDTNKVNTEVRITKSYPTAFYRRFLFLKPWAIEVFSGIKKEREGKREVVLLSKSDFLLSYGTSEGFAAVVVESNCQFGSFATLVRSASHLPRLRRSANFSSTLWTLCHTHSSLKHYMMLKIKHFSS